MGAYVASWLTPLTDSTLYERVVKASFLMESACGIYTTVKQGLLQTPVEMKKKTLEGLAYTEMSGFCNYPAVY